MTTVVVLLAGLEALCRLFDHDPPARPVASYITVWNDGEFYTVKSAATGWPPWEDYNHDGMRDREHPVERQPGVRRVMMLGDSVTLGYGLRPEQAYPQVLQDLLDARGRQAEVFNVAFSGWSTRQERIAYERIGRRYHPDDVIVAVCLNDLPEIHNNLARPPRVLQALHARSALVRRLVGARRREIHDVEELFTASESPSVRDAFARFFEEVRQLRGEVEADGGRFGLAVLPFRMQIEDRGTPGVQERISTFCAAAKIPFLDLLPALRPLGQDAFLDYDHLSAAGARRVADAFADSVLLQAHQSDERGARAPEAATSTSAAAPPGIPRLERLRDPDPTTRAATARALGNAGAEAKTVVPALARALTDPEPAVRAAAAWALGGFAASAASAVRELTDALADDNPSVRAGAAHTLGAIGPAARPIANALAPRLADSAQEVRWRTEDALARIGPDTATALPVLLPLLADPVGRGRGGAASVIARMGPAAQAAVPALMSALSDAHDDVRWKAAWALSEIGPGARAAVPALVVLVPDPDVGWHAIDALGSIGPAARSAVPVLRSALADPSSNVRWRAALALSHIGPDAAPAIPELIAALHDPVDNVRLAAVHALSRTAPDAVPVPALADALRRDGDSRVRAAAALALGHEVMGGGAARDALVAATSDPDAMVRASSVRALGHDPSSPASAALARALSDPDPGVRAEAARAAKGRRR